MDENRLSALEDRTRRIEDKLDKVLENHGNRITKIETEAGFIKSGLALAVTIVVAACTWAFNKVFT